MSLTVHAVFLIDNAFCFQESDELMEWWNTVKGLHDCVKLVCPSHTYNKKKDMYLLHVIIVLCLLLVSRLG